MLNTIKAYGFAALSIVLGVLLATQTLRLHAEQRSHDQLKLAVAEERALREASARSAVQGLQIKERERAARTQENVDEFQVSAPVRDALARADLARSERLRLDAERRAATYRAMSQASAAACGDLADRHAALDAHVVRGAEVVGRLRGDLARRDDEVKLLRTQIDIERAVSEREKLGR